MLPQLIWIIFTSKMKELTHFLTFKENYHKFAIPVAEHNLKTTHEGPMLQPGVRQGNRSGSCKQILRVEDKTQTGYDGISVPRFRKFF